MPIPSEKDIKIPLLHLIYTLGGEVKPSNVYNKLADYFKLSEKELEEMQPSGIDGKFKNIVRWARNSLCSQGFLDRSKRGVWKITKKGKKELYHLGLANLPFSRTTSFQSQNLSESNNNTKDLKLSYEEILELVLKEVAPDGQKHFPNDFLDNKNSSNFIELNLPGTELRLSPLSRTIITSPEGYFHYQAKNPSEAKYILYSNKTGLKRIKIPKDSLIMFKIVKAYERYCDKVIRMSFEMLLEFTYDEQKAGILAGEIANKLGLKGMLSKQEP